MKWTHVKQDRFGAEFYIAKGAWARYCCEGKWEAFDHKDETFSTHATAEDAMLHIEEKR